MSRRSGARDVGFESDSFLDIIANIVGILIILIVVAGMRVSQAPVILPQASAETSPAEIDPFDMSVPDVPPPIDPDELPIDVPAFASEEPEEIEPSPELLALQEEITRELERLNSETNRASGQLEHVVAARHSVESETVAIEQSLLRADDGPKDNDGRLLALRTSVDQKRRMRDLLSRRIKQAEQADSSAKKLEHKLMPMSREVQGKELHFRLFENRVSYVPIDQLIERLRPQIARHQDWLVKYRRHQGRVGPVRGYSMSYVVERQRTSLVEDLRSGSGMMQISVSRWQVDPEPELMTESVEEALRPGSLYVRTLMLSDPSTALTFWVYPDSFALYRGLQAFAHEQGFRVAARPLPFDVPIAGSPQGSRSAGQ